MNRRKFMIGTGSIGAAAIGGAVLMSGSAVAEIEDSTFSGTTIRGESDDGSVDDVVVEATNIGFAYEGLENPATEAEVTLQVVYNEDPADIDSAVRDDISGTSQSGLALGDDLEGSILVHDELDAADFESNTDGEESRFEDATLRLVVEVRSTSGSEATGSDDAFLNVVMQNTESDASVGGEADGEVVTDFETIGTGTSDDGDMTLEAAYGADEYRFRATVTGAYSDDDEPHANFGIGLDFEPDTDVYQYQLNWSTEDSFFHHVDATDGQEGLPAGITADRVDDDTFIFTIDVEQSSWDWPEDGDQYGIVGHASAGGEYDSVSVSKDGENAWSSDNDWASNEYFITHTVDAS